MVFSETIQHLVRKDEPLASLTWAGTGGSAKYYAEPTTSTEVAALVRDARAADLPVRTLGDGANVLVRDSGFDGLVINLATAELSQIRVEDQQIVAGAGAKLSHVISKAVGAGLAGIEYLAGIPGTIGGAVVCNAAVKNGDLGSRVVEVEALEPSGDLVTLGREQLQFGFQRSNLDDLVVLSVTLKLYPIEQNELTRRMQSAWIVKRAAQPNSGTRTLLAFVEPDGMSLVETLEAAQMRNHAEGEVKICSNYPGFITIAGEASSDQVIALIENVTRTVEARTGVRLQSRVKIW